MKIYEMQTTQLKTYVGAKCDGCGSTDPYLIEVILSVHEGEDGGACDVLDFCDNCFDVRIPALAAAGSRAPIVTGVELPEEADALPQNG